MTLSIFLNLSMVFYKEGAEIVAGGGVSGALTAGACGVGATGAGADGACSTVFTTVSTTVSVT